MDYISEMSAFCGATEGIGDLFANHGVKQGRMVYRNNIDDIPKFSSMADFIKSIHAENGAIERYDRKSGTKMVDYEGMVGGLHVDVTFYDDSPCDSFIEATFKTAYNNIGTARKLIAEQLNVAGMNLTGKIKSQLKYDCLDIYVSEKTLENGVYFKYGFDIVDDNGDNHWMTLRARPDGHNANKLQFAKQCSADG